MSEELKILEDFPATTPEEWRAAAEKLLKGKPFDKVLIKKTYEGIDIQPIYNMDVLDACPYTQTLPGEVPFVRGTDAAGPRVAGWNVAQEITEPDPAEFNAALTHDLTKGQTAVNIVFDKAVRAGLEPGDAPADSLGCGLSVGVAEDVAAALRGVDLSALPLYAEAGTAGAAVAAMIAAALKADGKSAADLKGCLGMDPLGELAMTGALPMSLSAAYDQMASLAKWAVADAPALKTTSVNVTAYQNAGCNAVQELAYALATGAEYVRELMGRGLSVDEAVGSVHFTFSIASDFFMEIAKFRAARMVWCNVARAFGAGDEAAKLKCLARTSRFNKTKVDPWVNMLRVTTETFSAIAGGATAIHTGPFDEVIRQPNDFSRRIARNVQIMMQDEAHFDKVVDPVGGCYYVEYLTGELARKSWELFQEIEGRGGMSAALTSGIPQEAVAGMAAARVKAVAVRKDRIVGTNMYPNMVEKAVEEYDFDVEAFQADRAAFVKGAKKDAAAELGVLAGSKSVADAIAAAAAGAGLGDIARVFIEGEAMTIPALYIHRVAETVEKLRRTTENWAAANGGNPQVFMANMGPVGQHKARADFSTGFVNVGMFETITNFGFETPEEAAQAAADSGAKASIICSTDATYPELVPAYCKAVKALVPDMMIIVAGYPKDHIESFKEAGVDDFLHVKANAVELIEKLQKHVGVI